MIKKFTKNGLTALIFLPQYGIGWGSYYNDNIKVDDHMETSPVMAINVNNKKKKGKKQEPI